MDPTSSYRARYENKPMAPLPDTTPTSSAQGRHKSRFHIHPATPYRMATPNPEHTKNRAATDPVVPQPLFASVKRSLAHLREKAPDFRTDKGASVDRESTQTYLLPPTPPPRMPSKALDLLGIQPVSRKNHKKMTASSPPPSIVAAPYRSSDDPSSLFPTPPRQVQSTPMPPQQGLLRGNAFLTPTPTNLSPASSRKTGNAAMASGSDGFSNPARKGTYGRVGEVASMNHNELHRVNSHVGILETYQPPTPTPTPTPTATENYVHFLRPYGVVQRSDSGASTYSTHEDYAGVWENDPHVGYSLPPFSPNPHLLQPPHPEVHVHNEPHPTRSTTAHGGFDDFSITTNHRHGHDPTGRFLDSLRPSLLSRDSYTSSNPHAGSHVASSTNPNEYEALLPPRPDYGNQPSWPLSGPMHVDPDLHDHVESCYASLATLVTEKHDRSHRRMDQVLQRLGRVEESMEGKFERMKEEMRGDLADVFKMISEGFEELKQDTAALHRETANEFDDFAQKMDGIRELTRGVDLKMETLEKKIEGFGWRYYRFNPEEVLSGDDFELPADVPSHQPPNRRRTDSAHAALFSSEQLRQRPSTSHEGRIQSGQSAQEGSQLRPSDNSSAAGSRDSNERGTANRREFVAELVAARGNPPDLSQHPAYQFPGSPAPRGRLSAAKASAAGKERSPRGLFQKPTFRHGLDWYQKAFS